MSDIRDAASVILVRERGGGPQLEVYMLRRHRKSGFMASSYVFPGGIADPRDHDDPRATAVRELFEEAGVLFSEPELDPSQTPGWRERVDQSGADLSLLLADHGAALALDRLTYYGHWITPSIEKRRYSARFYVAFVPGGQVASPCDRETVDEVWLTPEEALEQSAELRLPPPQVRTFHEIAEACRQGYDYLLALCRERAKTPHPILPRMALKDDGGFHLLLPWDPEYESKGQGDSKPLPADHPLATGPSRFILTPEGWKNIEA